MSAADTTLADQQFLEELVVAAEAFGTTPEDIAALGAGARSVTEFGAIGNGVVDDTAAFAAAIAEVRATNGGDLYVPRGTYKITAPLTVTGDTGSDTNLTHYGVRIRGAGRNTTILSYAPAAATFLLNLGNDTAKSVAHFSLEDLTVSLANTTAAGGVAVDDPSSFGTIQRVLFRGQDTSHGEGIRFSGQVSAASHHQVNMCAFSTMESGIRFSGFGNSNLVQSCWFGSLTNGIYCEKVGTDTTGGDTNTFVRCEFNGSTGTAVKLRSSADRNVFVGCTMDGPTVHFDISSSSAGTTIIGCSYDELASVFGAANTVKVNYLSMPTVTGSRGANAALASLLTSLAGIGLITNSTSA